MGTDLTVGVAAPTALVFAVLTYRRPRDLATLLPLLVRQARSVARDGLAVSILVVDNDAEASARTVVERWGSDSIVSVTYRTEAQAGIAAARNRALTEAEGADLLIFLDDDERPSEHWAERLLTTYAEHGSTAVVGPVVSEFEGELDPWIRAGRFFTRRRLPTGTLVSVAATNNLLLDLRQVRALGLSFDPRFGTAGGEDTLFTRAIVRGGGSMVWCDEAVVVDVVPRSRMTRRWVLARAFSSGNGWSLTSVALAGSRAGRWAARSRVAGQGIVRVVGGSGRLLVGAAARSRAQRARGARTLARGAGMLTGTFGYTFQEYRRPGRRR